MPWTWIPSYGSLALMRVFFPFSLVCSMIYFVFILNISGWEAIRILSKCNFLWTENSFLVCCWMFHCITYSNCRLSTRHHPMFQTLTLCAPTNKKKEITPKEENNTFPLKNTSTCNRHQCWLSQLKAVGYLTWEKH